MVNWWLNDGYWWLIKWGLLSHLGGYLLSCLTTAILNLCSRIVNQYCPVGTTVKCINHYQLVGRHIASEAPTKRNWQALVHRSHPCWLVFPAIVEAMIRNSNQGKLLRVNDVTPMIFVRDHCLIELYRLFAMVQKPSWLGDAKIAGRLHFWLKMLSTVLTSCR